MPEHRSQHFRVARDPRQSRFAIFGEDEDIEVWSFENGPKLKIIHTGQRPIYGVAFSPDGRSIIVAPSDSQVTRWSLENDTHQRVARLVLVGLRDCIGTSQVGVLTNTQDWIWNGQQVRPIGEQSTFRHAMICSLDGAWFAEGFTDGNVRLRSTLTGWSFTVIEAGEAIRWISMSPDNAEVAVTIKNQLIIRSRSEAYPQTAPLRIRVVGAHYVTHSADGKLLVTQCDNGDVWFYRRSDGHWLYRSVGAAASQPGSFSADSAHFVATDDSGGVFVFDVTASSFRL